MIKLVMDICYLSGMQYAYDYIRPTFENQTLVIITIEDYLTISGVKRHNKQIFF